MFFTCIMSNNDLYQDNISDYISFYINFLHIWNYKSNVFVPSPSKWVQNMCKNGCTLTSNSHSPIPNNTQRYASVNAHKQDHLSSIQCGLWIDPASLIFIWCSVFVIQATYPFTQRAFANRIDADRTVHNTVARFLLAELEGGRSWSIPNGLGNSGCFKKKKVWWSS